MAKISFDYQSIKDRILQILSSKSEWASFLGYGAIDNVISSIANEMAYQVQYSEYNALENYWNLARNKSSLLQMAPMHGYIVPRKQASSGTVRISASETFDTPYGNDINIPKFFQMSGNDIYVCTDTNYTLTSDESYIDVRCVQGDVKSLKFIAEGILYEEKIIYDDSIDNSFFVLTVNGIEWKYVDSLFLHENDEKVYQIRTLPSFKGIQIQFGNNIYGKKLEKDDIVEFKYISTLGDKGNIFASDIINTIESQAFDVNNNPVNLYCRNTTMFVGGKDSVGIEEIREVSPKIYQTGDRVSSRDDYYAVLKNFNFLSKVSVWGAYETLKDQHKDVWEFLPSEENVIHLALFDSAYQNISTEQKTQIIESLYPKIDPTDIILFEECHMIPMVFIIDATIINTSYTTVEVESNIKENLNNMYGKEVMDFGESVYDSDYVRLIDETKGIDNHLTQIQLYEEGKMFTSAYNGSFELPIYPVDYESVRIYFKDTSDDNAKYELLATCDSNGNIVGEGIYITTDSSLDLNTGKGNLYVTGLTGDYHNYMIKITYQYISDNLMNTSRSNLLYYDNAEITLKYK